MSKQPFSWEKCKQTEPPGLAMLDGKVVTIVGPTLCPGSDGYYYVQSDKGHGEIHGETVLSVPGSSLSNLPEEPEKPELDDPAYAVRRITVDPNLATMEEMAEAGVLITYHGDRWSVCGPPNTIRWTFVFTGYGGKLPALRAAREYATKLVNEARR